jgi:hypothetical protein
MTRVEFLISLCRYRVFPLASELEDLEDAIPRAHSNQSGRVIP